MQTPVNSGCSSGEPSGERIVSCMEQDSHMESGNFTSLVIVYPHSQASSATCCSANLTTFSRRNSMSPSWLSKWHKWTAKNWMQYSGSHVAYTATMALLLSQNGLRNNLRASDF